MTTVLLAGDSLAVGLTGPMRQLTAERGIDLVADATSGTTARQWAGSGRLAADVEANRPQIVLVSLGTNDARGDLARFRSDIGALVDACRGSSLRWIAPPSMPFDTMAVRADILSVLGARDVPIFRSEARTYPRAADGIHMPPNGYNAWADDIVAAGFLDSSVPTNKRKWLIAGAAAVFVAWAAGWI